MDWFQGLLPVWQALLGGLFTWGVTAIGAAGVFLHKNPPKRFLQAMLGFAAGVMLAASFWSLLSPAIELASHSGTAPWIPAAVGFVVGAGCLALGDRLLPHLHRRSDQDHREGMSVAWRRSTLLFSAMTLHNIPEGLAIGVAFGAAAHGGDFALGASLSGAVALTLGIGLQNFPEGVAVALPLRQTRLSRTKAFLVGQASALVEPVAAVVGALVVAQSTAILPYALAFAAGAMVFVVVEELIPQAQEEGGEDIATASIIIGFAIMMVLDVALG